MAYKTLYPEGYYRKNWTRLFEKYRNHMDLEKELDWFTPTFEELPEDLREQAKMAARKIGAVKVADKAKESLLKDMRMIQEIRDGKAGLGYTSEKQRVEQWHMIQQRFEFECLQLKEFKEKYNIA